jgi:hypothetical protein
MTGIFDELHYISHYPVINFYELTLFPPKKKCTAKFRANIILLLKGYIPEKLKWAP